MSPVVTRTPAGSPSSTATSAGPCDSPAVSHRRMPPIVYDRTCEGPARNAGRAFERGSSAHDEAVGRPGCDVDRSAVTELDGGLTVLDRQEREVLRERRAVGGARLRGDHVAERLGDQRLAVAVAHDEGRRLGAVDLDQLEPDGAVRVDGRRAAGRGARAGAGAGRGARAGAGAGAGRGARARAVSAAG